jgi:hypothetical protein
MMVLREQSVPKLTLNGNYLGWHEDRAANVSEIGCDRYVYPIRIFYLHKIFLE